MSENKIGEWFVDRGCLLIFLIIGAILPCLTIIFKDTSPYVFPVEVDGVVYQSYGYPAKDGNTIKITSRAGKKRTITFKEVKELEPYREGER